jgi:OmpA-OmpF porin, OOP family
MMSNFNALTEEIEVRFDLGPKARIIVQELLGFIAEQPGGIDGFLDRIQNAGHAEAEKVASWFGSPYPWALSAREVKRALSAEFIERIAQRTNLTERFTGKVLGYAIPKLIVHLEADCPVPVAAPARLRYPDPAFSSEPPQFETLIFWRKHMPKFATEVHSPALPLIVPAAAVLVTLGLIWHSITVGSAGDHFVFRPAPIMAENPPAPVLSSRDAGNLDASFMVTAGWIENLSALVGRSKGQDLKAPAAHNDFNVGGAPSKANGIWVVSLLPAAQLPQFVVAAETGRGPAKMKLASSANEPVGIQNLAAVDFPTIIFLPNSIEVPARGIPLLRRAAIQIKQLPSGTLVQLNGYTHGARMSAGDMKLSQRRADSVYRVLVRNGVSPAMLSAKGYGSAESLASTDKIAEGRSTNGANGGPQADRRVEFRIIPPRQ